jgi:hypothetical protein
MAIYGIYQCGECQHQFRGWREKDGQYPKCPECGIEGGWAPQAPALNGIKAKAIDIAQKIAEETFGMTDMKDNLRQGDTIVKAPPPIQTAESEAMTRELLTAGVGTPEVAPHLQQYVQNFFGATGAGPSVDPLASIQGAAPAANEARSMGVDPLGLLHKGKGYGGGINKIVPINKPGKATQ